MFSLATSFTILPVSNTTCPENITLVVSLTFMRDEVCWKCVKNSPAPFMDRNNVPDTVYLQSSMVPFSQKCRSMYEIQNCSTFTAHLRQSTTVFADGHWKEICLSWFNHLEDIFSEKKPRGCGIILDNAGDQNKSTFSLCHFFVEHYTLNTTYPSLFLTANSHYWSVTSMSVNAAVMLTSAGQITVVGWESSSCKDFSTTAYFST